MITSSLVDAEVRVRMITQPDPFSAFFKLSFRLWEWSKCYATHTVFSAIAADTVVCALGTSFLPHFVQNYDKTSKFDAKITEKTVESKRGNEKCLHCSPIAACVTIQGRDRVNIPKSQGVFPLSEIGLK
ncbi:hypothetical protein PoB_001479200 [Plakobranchus ocellatus]|uniref:Uncharacterized protein n=1 Tax=Plakobranchus ocellatus TaxID=259542 RepID=A0AAV3Z180_9GAST|nr:hypothetical protein PoB_001479200 [Plakobranchus ocellatus]